MKTFWRTMAALRLALGLAPEKLWQRGLKAAGFPESAITTWVAAELSRGSSVDIAEAGRELGRYDSTAWIAGIDAPAAVIVTTQDTAVPPSKQRALAAAMRAPVYEVHGDHGAVIVKRRRVQRPAARRARRRARPAGHRDPLMDGLARGDDGVVRCAWGDSTPDYRVYHDEEWGRPVGDDVRLFEKLCLEGFQSGLSWLTILRKRENFRAAFAGFDFKTVAAYTDDDVERLLQDAGIIRHRGKIEATINNAQRAVEMVDGRGVARRASSGVMTTPLPWPRSSSAAAGASSARPPSTRSCRRWAWSTTTCAGCDAREPCERERAAFTPPAA